MFRPHPLATVLRPRRGLGSRPELHCRPSVGQLAAQEWGGFGQPGMLPLVRESAAGPWR